MISFTPWGKIRAALHEKSLSQYSIDIAEFGEQEYKRGIASPKSGRYYGSHKASAEGEFPASRTGAHKNSIRSRSTRRMAEVSSNVAHSKFLLGTSRMGPRLMSKDALERAIPKARAKLGRWARYERD